MNKTLYASDPKLWARFEELARLRRSSVSREVERLMRVELTAAHIEERIRATVAARDGAAGDPPNLIREVSRLEREIDAIRFAIAHGGRREDVR